GRLHAWILACGHDVHRRLHRCSLCSENERCLAKTHFPRGGSTTCFKDNLRSDRLNKMLNVTPQFVAHIRRELSKTVVGQYEVIEQILIAMLAEGHALLEGVPGTAKTLTIKTLAQTLGSQYSRIQFTPDLMPSDITGTNVFNMRTSEFNLRRG